jgi:hypothetical protein
MMKKTLLLVTILLVLTTVLTAQNSFKNLNGSADEMDSMRVPDSRTLGVKSKAAMLPIIFKDGKTAFDFPVESTENLRLTLLAPNSVGWEIKASNDVNKDINLRNNPEFVERRDGEVGMDGVKFPAEVFSFNYVKNGNWRVEIFTGKGANLRNSGTVGYLVVSNDSPYQLYSYVDTHQTLVGRNIGIFTSVFDNSAGTNSEIEGAVRSIEGEIRTPNGSTQKLNFSGNVEGIFGGNFVPREAGQYLVQITVRGVSPKGENFIRTSEQLLQVLGDNVKFGRGAVSNLIDNTRLQVNIPVNGLQAGRKVIAYGEIWARNSSGTKIPVAWISGMSVAEESGRIAELPLVLDGRWLSLADAKDGFELRNVRIQDADYFVTLATADQISLAIPAIPENARSFNGEISSEMRTGKRPTTEPIENAVGGKLMLVHGYCSGDVWGSVAGQFSNSIKFSDLNQNRSHDQFANLIKNFGASYPSFGIVAHSQGGAASLHLYTYYWSGLDYATGGSRLIQTVGTPYQGTALAGNLAALGNVFGVGCGTNYDLTYNGSASWLAGIPSWARAKVHYSTTSFKDVWYAYDYCNIATDLFLNDPDDGVVERAYAQLPGANNRGHKTGWCHTSGMRDPAQTSDSSRNADMSANAAR